MSVPRSIGWAVFYKNSPDPNPKLTRSHIYTTRNVAIAAYYRDNARAYSNQNLSPADIKATRQAKVLQHYDIKEVFIHD